MSTKKKNPPEPEKSLFKWSIHPAKKRPFTTFFIMAFILFFGYAIDFFIKEHLISGAVVFVFVVSLKKWFLKTEYFVTDRGIKISILGSKDFLPWEKISRISKSGKGFYVERKDISAVMQGVKGVFLVTSRDMVFIEKSKDKNSDAEQSMPDIEANLEKIFVNMGKI